MRIKEEARPDVHFTNKTLYLSPTRGNKDAIHEENPVPNLVNLGRGYFCGVSLYSVKMFGVLASGRLVSKPLSS